MNAMNSDVQAFHSAIAARRATREYDARPIAEEQLDRIVGAALEAPSAFNLQLRDVVVVRDAEVKNKLTETSGQPQFAAADTVLVFVTREEAIPADAAEILPASYLERVSGMKAELPAPVLREMAMKDTMLAAGFALAAAAVEGIATSPTTGWDEATVKELIGLGGVADRGVALVVAMGNPVKDAQPAAHPGRQATRRVNESYAK